MHIFCTKCGKHIDVSLEELENQNGHLVCPQCLAEIDVDVELFNFNASSVPNEENNEEDTTVAPPQQQEPPSHAKPPVLPVAAHTGDTHQAQSTTGSGTTTVQPPHIDDVMRYCKHCGAFLREGVNFCPKCGKYVRVTPPPPIVKPPLTPAQQQAAQLRASTPPVKHVHTNKKSTYKPPQGPPYQNTSMGQQRNPLNSVRNSGNRRSSKNSDSKRSKFSIHSIGGCLTLTVVAVAIFFIIYIIIGVNFE